MACLHSPASLIPRSDNASSVPSSVFREAVEKDPVMSTFQWKSPLLQATPSSSSSLPDISSLSSRLRRLDDLLNALRELHQLFQTATDREISTRGAEIISLVEVAQSTLTKARIHLWRYSPCPVHFHPHKRLYFLVLKDLKIRGSCFDVSLRRRWGVLVFHLSEDFKWGGSYRTFYASSFGAPRKPSSGRVNTAFDATAKQDTPSTESMPPPSAFPTSEGISSLSLLAPRRKAKPLDIIEFFPDVALSLQARRPMKQRFGIFCTPKTSMFRPPPIAHRGKAFVRGASRHSLISD
ncbi:hypothetical protein E1B28_013669 [Marasmius oreades]|uniref:Uncharacterized protein n=1 Tax=Marasmius oreades TaxID=181124 RepID=A0A9P7UN10_9AGAR|nr:uncharacterized protein E1B28_013669 [Marasmius oreades]KAG7087723.1 hypothetical protein E1B28_013669 [Marasmius oreades]